MRYSDKIYISEKIDDFNQIKKLMEEKISIYNVFFICIKDKDDKSFMEILSTSEILKPFRNVKDYKIIGIAKGKKDSFNLLKIIFEDFLKENNNLDNVREYFL